MKNIFSALMLLLIVAFSTLAVAGQTSVFTQQKTLYSAVSGTTAAVNTSAFTFDYPVNSVACDFIVGASSAETDGVTFAVYGNQGSSATLFDTGLALISSVTSSPVSASTSTMVTRGKNASFLGPFRTMYATFTAASATQPITINCTGTQ
jgi:hypothetical protein